MKNIGLTIGSLVSNPNFNTPDETHESSVKKYAYIISIVLSSLATVFCCVPFLSCSVYQLTTLKKLLRFGNDTYDYHLLLNKEPTESNTPYTDYPPNDVSLTHDD